MAVSLHVNNPTAMFLPFIFALGYMHRLLMFYGIVQQELDENSSLKSKSKNKMCFFFFLVYVSDFWF